MLILFLDINIKVFQIALREKNALTEEIIQKHLGDALE